MKNYFAKNLIAVAIIATTSISTYAQSETGEEIKSTLDLGFRYRIETVDQDGFSKDALASTLRTRATIKTDWTSGFDSVLEFDDVSVVGDDNYNAGQGNTPNRGQYPVVADPDGTEVNQAFVRYNLESTKIAYGRQRILIENQRFVGGVGWRQNEQTYDGLTVNTKIGSDLNFNYAYISNVNRIFGEQVNAGDHKHNSHLVNADFKIADAKLSMYYFSLDNESAAALSSDTLGVRFAGKLSDFNYAVEYASQSDGGDNPINYSADYYLLEGAYKQENYSFGAGYEVLGGDVDGGQGFTTSLATLHKFQGWADVFLGTPVAGIKDTYLNGTFNSNGFNFSLVYHDFATDEGSADLGTEIDFSVAKKINANLSALFKYADFSSDNANYASREKVWLMLTYTM